MARNFPQYAGHRAATKAGCFSCGARLDGNPEATGYPEGSWRQHCTACDMFTSYDLLGPGEPCGDCGQAIRPATNAATTER